MSKILRDEELKNFIKELNITYNEEIFNIILCLDDESKYVINGETVVEIDKDILKKYM